MATVDGITAAKAEEIKNGSIVTGAVDGVTGHLILTTAGGTQVDAGVVAPKPTVITHTANTPLTWKKSDYPGMTRAKFEMWGGGGGGSVGKTTNGGGGGGGGGYHSVELTVLVVSSA